jgi:hypothetical protein
VGYIQKWWPTQLHCLVVIVRLGSWLVNHNCCVDTKPQVFLAQWNVFGGGRHLEADTFNID